MAGLSAIRDGLQTRLVTVAGLRVYDTWPDQVNLPCAIVRPTGIQYRQDGGNRTLFTFEVVLLVQSVQSGLARGQDKLDAYLDATGATSIRAALEADGTLGGLVSDLIVSGARDYGALSVADVQYLGAKLDVQVWA